MAGKTSVLIVTCRKCKRTLFRTTVRAGDARCSKCKVWTKFRQ